MLPISAQMHAVPLAGTVNDWRHALKAHYLRLGKTSRQRRFMAVLPDRSISLIANRASPVIVLGIKAGGRVIGVVEVFTGIDHHAEIGISVEDLYQGQGYGKALFLDGLVAADKIGVRTADLYFSSENCGIRSLVQAAGGHVLQNGSDCEAHIDVAHYLASCT